MECKQCGQCCRHLIIDEVYDIDIMREPKLRKYVEECRNEPGRYFMKTPCPFLIVNVGGITHNKCSIYPTRPNICIAFEPGSNDCCPQKAKGKLKR